jgi:virginiamycin B lyase
MRLLVERNAGRKTLALVLTASLFFLAVPAAAAEDPIEIGPGDGLPPLCQPNDIDLDAQGNPWVACLGSEQANGKDDAIAVIDPSTRKVALYDVPDSCGPYMGAFDAQGRYWFTMRDCNRLGMIEPGSSKVNEYAVTQNATMPKGIAVDAQGRIWAALEFGVPQEPDYVGRYDPSAKIWDIVRQTETGTKLLDVTVLKNGKVIVCDFLGGGVYRFDPATLAYARVPIPAILEPTWCRESPDGHLWITSHGQNTYLMRVGANDDYRNFTFPQVGLLPYAVAFDRDGNVWWTEHLGNHLHRIAKDGTFGSRIAIPTPQSYPFSLAINQKNCDAWVGESQGNRVFFVPGSTICPDSGRGTFKLGLLDWIIIGAIGGGALGLVNALIIRRRKRQAAAGPLSKEQEAKKKAKDSL